MGFPAAAAAVSSAGWFWGAGVPAVFSVLSCLSWDPVFEGLSGLQEISSVFKPTEQASAHSLRLLMAPEVLLVAVTEGKDQVGGQEEPDSEG